MKLVRFGPAGAERPGIVRPDGRVVSLERVVGDIAGSVLSPEGLRQLRGADLTALPVVDEGTRLGAPIGRIGKVVAIGLNYADHAAETGAAIPSEPVLFLKAISSVCGPNDDVIIPKGATKVDWEVELGVVIGTRAVNVSEADALNHVAGYCLVNDVSERAWQLEGSGTWDKGKGADTFCPIGPWLVTADEVADPQALELWLEVDGVRRQQGSTSTMIFTVAQIISAVSNWMSLQPGDVVITGTPPGVALGMADPAWLQAGQRMRLSVEGLGVQEQRVTE